MSDIHIRACAKVNLSLEVLGKRADGFHEVRTIMQSIELSDSLLFAQLDPSAGIRLTCSEPALVTDDNLVLKAARLLRDTSGRELGAAIRLEKGIPEAAGLGGGSADAAATLVGLSLLWGIDLSDAGMDGLASALGSDVPFFLRGGAALASGRGEAISILADIEPHWLVLAVPTHTVQGKTGLLYRRMAPRHWSDGKRTLRLAAEIDARKPLDYSLLGNSFEQVAGDVFPGLDGLSNDMVECGAPSTHLSGAGPTLFSIFRSEDDAARTAASLRARGHRAFLTHTLPRDEARLTPSRLP